MGNIRIERVPIQEFGLWRIRADHLMLVFQQDPLDYGYYQDRWWVMEGTRDTNPDGTVTVGVDGANGVTTLSGANGGKNEQELLDTIGYPWWRGSQIIASTDALTDWGLMAAVARDIDRQAFPYFAFGVDFSPLPIANSSSIVASLLFYIGVDIAQNMPSMFLSFTVGTRTLFGTSDDDPIKLSLSFNTVLSGEGNDTLQGTDEAGEVEKLYGGRGDDEFLWSEGNHIYHGGQPGLDYPEDGNDVINYAGVGTIYIEGGLADVPHLLATYIVTHTTGVDRLFSIDNIRWDDTSDTIILGEGVELGEIRPILELNGQGSQSRGDALDFSTRTTGLLAAPSDQPEILLVGVEARDGNFSDAGGIWAQSLEYLGGTSANDRIYAAPAMTGVEGGKGDDLISGRFVTPLSAASPLGYDIELSGGMGDDTIISGTGRSLALGGEGADRFIISSLSEATRIVEFVIADADAADRLFVPYNLLLAEAGAFQGSALFPILGAMTPVIGRATFDVLPQNPGPGAVNGYDAPGFFYLVSQVSLEGNGADAWDGVVRITDQILFNRDGDDLLIHIYAGGPAFAQTFFNLMDQDFTFQEIDTDLFSEAVVRVVDFEEGMLGIRFYELGEETPFPYPGGSGPPNAAKIWNTDTFAAAGDTFLTGPLDAEPETPIYDRNRNGEPDNRDVIAGSEGDDILTLASNARRTVGDSSGADLSGGDGNDELTGGNGRDVLDGGSGDDIMAGGGGNDRYIVDVAGDIVIETFNAGIDTVVSSIGYTLPEFVEHLTLTGAAAFGEGNDASNRLTGTANADFLSGLNGDDTLIGGVGNDTLVGGAGNDTYVYQAGDGIDVILSSTGLNGSDVLRFIGIGRQDVAVFQSSGLDDIVLRMADGGRVVLDNFFAGPPIDVVRFDDGAAWNGAFLTAAALASGALVNDAPIAGADNGLFTDLTDVVIPKAELLGNDRDLDGDALTIIAVASKTPGANITLTPDGDVRVATQQAQTGLVEFDYTVADGRGGATTATVSLTIVANAAPVLSGPLLVSQSIAAGDAWTYSIPLDTFSDPDGHSLIYTADLADGSALPAWLDYDPQTRTFQGTPPPAFNGDLAVRVTASDSIAKTSTTFALSVIGLVHGEILVGSAGDDVLVGGGANDTITGGRGNDTLSGLGGDDVFLVTGNAGLDRYDGGAGFDTIRGSAGNDVIGLSGSVPIASIEAIDGGGGFDILRLDNTSNSLDLTQVTVTSIEQISAGGGGDSIIGSAGDDTIAGGAGNDTLFGGLGNDTFVFAGRPGRDTFDGGAGFDTIKGSAGNDILVLDKGLADIISIEAIDFGSGFDVLRLGSAADAIDLSGMTVSGLEQIEGAGGNDRMSGSGANEILVGGAGQDIFVFQGAFGHDTIADFQLQQSLRRNGDVIDVSALSFASFFEVLAHTQQVGTDSVISDPDGPSTITLLNIAKSLLQPDDFAV